MIRRGTWTPLLPPRWRWPTVLMLILTPIVAGADYIVGDWSSRTMNVVEAALPSWAWGTLLLGGGFVAVAGYFGRWRRTCILGLHVVGTTFFTIAVGVGWEAATGAGSFWLPWLYTVLATTSWTTALGYAQQGKEDADGVE